MPSPIKREPVEGLFYYFDVNEPMTDFEWLQIVETGLSLECIIASFGQPPEKWIEEIRERNARRQGR